MLQRVGMAAIVGAVVLWLAVYGSAPRLSDEEKASREAFSLSFKRAAERRISSAAAEERVCIERKQKLNPTWAESHIERECQREVFDDWTPPAAILPTR
jgi:hypothetical protein